MPSKYSLSSFLEHVSSVQQAQGNGVGTTQIRCKDDSFGPYPSKGRLIRKTTLWGVRSRWKENGKEHTEKSFKMKVAVRRAIASTALGTVDWAVKQLWSHQLESLYLESEAISMCAHNNSHHS